MSSSLTPPPERDFPAGRLQQRKEQLVSQLSGASTFVAPSRPRRLLVCAAVVALAGVLSAAGYAGYKLTRVTPVVTSGCYETDSLDANTAVVVPGSGSPLAACAATYASAFPGSPEPPNFAACVLPSGAVGVFPSDTGDTCRRLGLANARARSK
jgi:hypothetical protein